jgi:hypothetical protein
MSLKELQKAGRQLVEAGLQKWRNNGKIVYVPKVEDGMANNVKSFKVSSFYSLFK